MKKCLFTILFFVCVFYNFGFAQDNDLELEVSETIREQCEHKVKAMSDHFAKIATKDEKDDIKDYHIEACLDLFIGSGEAVLDEAGNVIFEAPRIEVSSRTKNTKNSYFIKNYLHRLKNLQYSKIVFKRTQCYLSEGGIKKIDENKYSAVVSFYQVFIGYKGDFVVYKDKTKKSVRILIEKDNQGKFDVLLGDITVDLTTDGNE